MKKEKNLKKNYPFTAIVGQEEMKKSLLLNIINPKIGGVLVFGEKGTAKSTAVRSLSSLLPEITVVKGCPFHCDPQQIEMMCDSCRNKYINGETLESEMIPMPIVDLPVSATEDRVVGSLDIEEAIQKGKKHFEPGILAKANRGILYVDEVNLLDDHIVDLLLDSAAMGVNTVEREGISFSHPAKFILVGTMNPEEGELRPQLLDRFGLSVEIKGLKNPKDRVEIVKLRGEYENDQSAFCEKYSEEEMKLQNKIENAKSSLSDILIEDNILYLNAKISIELKVDGHRSDITLMKTEKALAALKGKKKVTKDEVRECVEMIFRHRMRMLPFETKRNINMDLINQIIDEEEGE